MSFRKWWWALSLALLTGMMLWAEFSPMHPAQAKVTPTPTLIPVTALDRTDALSRELRLIIQSRKLGVAILPVGEAAQTMSIVGVNLDDQYSVASAFKGPVAIYFFENVSPDVWRSLPLNYWNIDKEDQIPDDYKSAWEDHHTILKAVYQMAVYSENVSSGDVLEYVYEALGKKAKNALAAFNDWAHQTVGISEKSGLQAWFAGGSSCVHGCADPRYGNEVIIYRQKVINLGNSYSPRDLATFYLYLATKGRELGYYDVALELLSVRKENPSLTKTFAGEQGIQVASKDGFVGPYSEGSDGFYISTDAGLFTLPNGEQYAVAFMALDAGDILHRVIIASSIALVQSGRILVMETK